MESGACSSCGGERRLERALDPLPYAEGLRAAIALEPELRRRIYGLGAAGALLFYAVCAVLLIGKLFPFTAPDSIKALVASLGLLTLFSVLTYPSARLRLWGYRPPDEVEPEP